MKLHTNTGFGLMASLLLVLAVCGQFQLYAAKGGGKEKKGYVLKFKTFDMKTNFQRQFTLKPGMQYKGSFNQVIKTPQTTTIQSIITYQRGTTTFIYPYQHRVSVPKFKTPEPVRN
ncbi:hypothetical protein GLV81_14010 [Phnomibacter ginsenosidimutans]|uniref:Uncharacterized protein n=2 Tax=Phnomibacter ginsenosidimutans TaxID=2676868 RepID=A0A6I6GVD1_9BACT|nr:hypothetical protein GLV81_14010 [Phnomibacter ginsenosidimutans]